MNIRCNNCFEVHSDSEKKCPYCGYVIGTPPKESFHLYPGTEILGRYIIGKVIGFGGFGTTYRAWDKLCSSVVAIKEYFPMGMASRNPSEKDVIIYTEKERQYNKGLASFIGEAASMVRFNNNDNIVNIYNYFEVNNTGYIVMEYLEGETLTEYLLRVKKKLPFEETIYIIDNVCNALLQLHKVGMVHRDISPENIFMCSNGKIKVIDFGAARETLDEDRRMTIILKPGYAPPEQYESVNKQGPWTDIYALGATLYLMLAGSKPQESTARRQNDSLLAPNKVDPNIPTYLSNLVMKAMSLDIKKRYKNIEEFREVLLSKTKTYPKSNLGLSGVQSNKESRRESYNGNQIGYNLDDDRASTQQRNKSRKIVPIILSVAVGVGIFVGLMVGAVLLNNRENGNKNTNSETRSMDNKITLWYTCADKTGKEQKKEAMKFLIENIEDANPGIDIVSKFYDSDVYQDALAKAIKLGKQPDIYETSNLEYKYIKNSCKTEDILKDIDYDEYYALNRIKKTDRYKYTIPLGFNVPVVYVNTAKDEKNYYTTISDLKELKYSDTPERILVDIDSESFFGDPEDMIFGAVYNDVDSSESVLDDFWLTPRDDIEPDANNYYYLLATSEYYGDLAESYEIIDNPEFDVLFYTNDNVGISYHDCFSVNSESRYKEEAITALRYMISKNGQNDFYLNCGIEAFPMNKEVCEEYGETLFPDIEFVSSLSNYKELF